MSIRHRIFEMDYSKSEPKINLETPNFKLLKTDYLSKKMFTTNIEKMLMVVGLFSKKKNIIKN